MHMPQYVVRIGMGLLTFSIKSSTVFLSCPSLTRISLPAIHFRPYSHPGNNTPESSRPPSPRRLALNPRATYFLLLSGFISCKTKWLTVNTNPHEQLDRNTQSISPTTRNHYALSVVQATYGLLSDSFIFWKSTQCI